MEIEKLSWGRKKFERKLREITGVFVVVNQMSIFSLPCGCEGLAANVGGLQKEDVEVYEDFFSSALREISLYVGIKPGILYTQMRPGGSEVIAFHSTDLCRRCKNEYEGKRPRSDLYIME
ncbi:MAG: DUF5402 family protein [Candidatus Syntropharchaeia archaeon]